MLDLVTLGDATIDTFLVIDDNSPQCELDIDAKKLCLNYADKIYITGMDQSIGGNASNVAVGVKKLGFKTAIVSELGDDINGLAIKQELEEQGVHTEHVILEKKRQTRISIVLNYKAERTILSHHDDKFSSITNIPSSKWLYYTSLGKGFENVQKKIIQKLKKEPQTKLVVNPGSYQINSGLEAFKHILPHTHMLFVNKEEAAVLAEKKADVPALIHVLHKKGPSYVVVTDGFHGSYASDGEHMLHMNIFPVEPVGKTGAGDAYASGFLSAIMKEKSLSEAMQWGTANAHGVIQKVGAHAGLLSEKGIKKVIKDHSHVLPTPIK